MSLRPLSPEVERLLAEGAQRRKNREESARVDHFADPDAIIPDLDLMPDCSICGSYDMEYEEGFYCNGCNVRWDRYGGKGVREDDQ